MSTVYRGMDTRLDRPVAIKIMDPRLAADPGYRARFQREARAAARITHPCVVDVHDQGEELHGPGGETALFLVMELVDGGTLRDVLRARGPVGVPAAVAVLDRVLSGLAEAHRLGLVHRDVKPENVLISRAGEVKVADFGLVAAAAGAGASHAGLILGTAAYLSPEQVQTGAADARSDVYAAGILLYELLTGTPPYTGDHVLSVAYRHVHDTVPAPSLIATDVPPELDALVAAATDRDPARRPAHAGAFLAELHRVAAELRIPRVPPPIPPARPVDEQDTVPSPSRPGGRFGTRALTVAPLDHPAPTGTVSHTPQYLRARRRGRVLFALWVVVVLVLALLVAAGAWWLGTGRWTEVPRLVGVELETAERLLTEADLVATTVREYHDDAAEGVVTATDPAPHTRLLRGSTVRVTVSAGRPTVPVITPGTSVEAAEEALRAVTLTPVRATAAVEYSTEVPAGAVLRTDPPAGTAVPVGAPVTLVLSRGSPPPPPPTQLRVPFVIGQRVEEATEILEQAGLKAEVRRTLPLGRRRGGVVISQRPQAGSQVDPGTTIRLETI